MKTLSAIIIVLLALAGVGAYFSLFIVKETQQAIILEFGKARKVITTPGLKWKIPVIQNVVFYDKRMLDIDTKPQEVIVSAPQAVNEDDSVAAKDGSNVSQIKRLVVDSFARYKIVDSLRFLQTVRSVENGRTRLGAVLDSSLRRVLGTATLEDVVRNKREELMALISQDVNAKGKRFGVEFVDVRIKRADLPKENSLSVYEDMKAARILEAKGIRSRGKKIAVEIRANADRRVTILKAEAVRDAQKIRGDGDAKRNEIFADAYGKDAGFFAFYRSMQAYEEGLQSNGTRMVISPDSEFFRYFNNPNGGAARR